MKSPAPLHVLLMILLIAGAGGGVWWLSQDQSPFPAPSNNENATDSAEDLPVPPVPPRIAQGADYDRCLSMLTTDPSGAYQMAENWKTGGDGAAHCAALAEIALGNAETGARMLETLGTTSKAPAIARASIFGQADQAWIIAGNTQKALEAASHALALAPDDPDLLIDRAVAFATLEHFKEAIADLNHALDIDSRRTDALVYRAASLRRLDKPDQAADDIARALDQDPDNVDALLERGILRQRQGNEDGARQDWERIISLAPDSATSDLAAQNLALQEAGPEQK
ncbi:Tetratricopeptide repeat family protein [Granulibacter bethesdensis]|uniref:tetratricopeptide repeat protein n=1 Tax=Granulibacter bethesdensis TaxID=364410 RepID=UPI00090A4457|nr:tetratricopeptide repeat protein [Granulibacter bethesdensis]APH56516.1 Tetratricopeptide repeat family protein [Granulibacter bethesdensis]